MVRPPDALMKKGLRPVRATPSLAGYRPPDALMKKGLRLLHWRFPVPWQGPPDALMKKGLRHLRDLVGKIMTRPPDALMKKGLRLHPRMNVKFKSKSARCPDEEGTETNPSRLIVKEIAVRPMP